MKQRIDVEHYRAEWPKTFDELRQIIWPIVNDVAASIEHVGSTSVPGLAAKPIIDIDIVVESLSLVPEVIRRLRELGYEHRGDLGVPGREAFRRPSGSPKHNLYVCIASSVAFRNHVMLRDYLRSNPAARDEYGQLKMRLAEEYAGNIDGYCEAKTSFIISILAQQGLSQSEIAEATGANVPGGEKNVSG